MYNGRDGVITERDSSLIYMRAGFCKAAFAKPLLQSRFYSPDLRRFINADLLHGDITNALTLNRYAYCNGDPVNGIDPQGLSKERGNTFEYDERLSLIPPDKLQALNEALEEYWKLYPITEKHIDMEKLRRLVEAHGAKLEVNKRRFIPYMGSTDTSDTVKMSSQEFYFVSADENSEFGYVKYGDDLYPIKYLDVTFNQSYFVGKDYTVAKYDNSKLNFSLVRALTGYVPSGLPDISEREIITKEGFILQKGGIGSSKQNGVIISSAVAFNEAYTFVIGGFVRPNMVVELSSSSDGNNKRAVFYSYINYMDLIITDYAIGMVASEPTYYGIDENGDIFVVC